MRPAVATLASTAVDAIWIRCKEAGRSIRSSHWDIVGRKAVCELSLHNDEARVWRKLLWLVMTREVKIHPELTFTLTHTMPL
jgi:hypothetical protein